MHQSCQKSGTVISDDVRQTDIAIKLALCLDVLRPDTAPNMRYVTRNVVGILSSQLCIKRLVIFSIYLYVARM
jgi:hypothetical protein